MCYMSSPSTIGIKDNPSFNMVPRVFIFSGKAAPAYCMAKLIIKLDQCCRPAWLTATRTYGIG